jgi:putative DNA primase/helicase
MTNRHVEAFNRGYEESKIIDMPDRRPKPNGSAPPPPPEPTSGSTLEVRGTTWMWHPRLPANQITLLGGKGGSCKGLICAGLTASTTNRKPWPDGTRADQGNVLWCETEDPLPEVVLPRLIAAGAERGHVWFADRACFAALDLRTYILANNIKLVVLSPCVSFLALTDINSEMGVREVLEKLQAAIEGTGCAVLGICHLNKKADLAAIERLLGSVAFSNFVRCVLLVAPENVEDRTFRLVHAKHNLSWKADDLLFTPKHVGTDPRDQFVKLEWSKPDSNVDHEALFDRKRAANGSERQSAGQWLTAYLTEHGESPREVVVFEAESAGFKEDTLVKAMMRSNTLQSRREGFPSRSWWSVK